MNQSLQNQETDYSSESELIFSNAKANCDTQDTITSNNLKRAIDNNYLDDDNVSKEIMELKDLEKSDTDQNIENELKPNNRKNLIKWAAKLELESLTLKELVKTDLGYILKQNYKFLDTSYSAVSEKIEKLETKVESIIETQYEKQLHTGKAYEGNNVIKKLLEQLITKVNNLESELIKKTRSAKTNKPIEDIITENILDTLQKSELGTSKRTLERNVKEILAQLNEVTNSLNSNSFQQNKLLNVTKDLEANFNSSFKRYEMSQKNDKLEDNLNELQGISEVKEYLKLLLPRIIGIENLCQRLFDEHSKLSNLIHQNETKPKPIVSPTIDDITSSLTPPQKVRAKRRKII